jgi:ParB-like chromosome segregation protein Spo0J
MDISIKKILEKVEPYLKEIESLDLDSRIDIINQIRALLHSISPFKDEPIDYVEWVKSERVMANDYNPNDVAKPEMDLLKLSMDIDGVTQPIVSWPTEGYDEVVDGFHRNLVGKEYGPVKDRLLGYLPLTFIKEKRGEEKGNRMASTIRHNRARGKHKVEDMSDIVLDLSRRNWSDEKIGTQLGMSPDEVLRLKQITGLAEMFVDQDFSMAWEADVINEDDNLIDED